MKDKKKLFSLIIILMIILLIMLVTYKILNNISRNKTVDGRYTQEDIDIIDDEVKNYLSDKIVPVGLAKLYGKYTGENDLNDMYRGIYSFVNYLPKLSEVVNYSDETDISNFYTNNKKDIRKNMGLLDETEFTDIVTYLCKNGYKGQSFINCRLDSSTFSPNGKYFSFVLTFNFEGLDEQIKLRLNFSNYEINDRLVYFSVINTEV